MNKSSEERFLKRLTAICNRFGILLVASDDTLRLEIPILGPGRYVRDSEGSVTWEGPTWTNESAEIPQASWDAMKPYLRESK